MRPGKVRLEADGLTQGSNSLVLSPLFAECGPETAKGPRIGRPDVGRLAKFGDGLVQSPVPGKYIAESGMCRSTPRTKRDCDSSKGNCLVPQGWLQQFQFRRQ